MKELSYAALFVWVGLTIFAHGAPMSSPAGQVPSAAIPASKSSVVVAPRVPQRQGKIPASPNLMLSDDLIIYMDPPSYTARTDEPFMSTVSLVCTKMKEFDKVDVRLAYNPKFVKPVSVHYFPIKDLMDGTPVFSVDQHAGRIRFSAKLKAPVRFQTQALLNIVWKPITETTETTIELGWPEQRSSVQLNGKDLLNSAVLASGNALPFDLAIISSPATRRSATVASAPASTPAESSNLSLGLEGPVGPFDKDEIFTVNVYLRNPDHAEFDTVSLLINYLSDKVHVEDWDRGNWITNGNNIHDGDHAAFPFDSYLANEVSDSKGEIFYRMGAKSPLRSDGIVAKIRARALSTRATTDDFRLTFARDENSTRTTEILKNGISQLSGGEMSQP